MTTTTFDTAADHIDFYIDKGYSYDEAYAAYAADLNREQIVSERQALVTKRAQARGYSYNEAQAFAALVEQQVVAGNVSKGLQLLSRLG